MYTGLKRRASTSKLSDFHVAKGNLPRSAILGKGVKGKMPGKAFRITFDSALREDLRRRLVETRWSDAVTTYWQYGTDKSFLRTLVQHRKTAYDFDAAEERLNALPQFRSTVAGFGVSYIHLKGSGPR